MIMTLRIIALLNAGCVGVNIGAYIYAHNPLNIMAAVFNLTVCMFVTFMEWNLDG